ncbi:thiamine biosynthesis lipoprotein [Burkholderia sp. WP9]|jgi:thiamine biosynthesis lipoprotein|uniref:FAD:protein FMN transferase n=2 Tax=Burkholderiaceae TaxID=119060 RepID=UPI00089AC286|nr:thiamine biosynthesis lipoprotein [Burkholderia sp. WP9]
MSKMSIEGPMAGCPERYTFNGPTMGTRYSVQCYAPAGLDRALIASELDAAVRAVDEEMSNWKDSSDLTRLNRAEPDVWVPISRNLATVLVRATEMGRETDNAFNAGVGDVVDQWGFGPSNAPRPTMREASRERPRRPLVELLDVNVEQCRARKQAHVSLDLCGIAKGFGVDELARVLDSHDVRSWLVGIDGEMRARGTKTGQALWAIAIERPDYERREALGVIELTDIAVATSGDYRHWSECEGKRISHVVDPRTGEPLCNGVASVTVLARSCMDADAYATALMVLGPQKGLDFARRKQLDALFLLRDGAQILAIGTGLFDAGFNGIEVPGG